MELINNNFIKLSKIDIFFTQILNKICIDYLYKNDFYINIRIINTAMTILAI